MYRHLSPNLQNGKWGHSLRHLFSRVHEGTVLLLARGVVPAPDFARLLPRLLFLGFLFFLGCLFDVDDFGLHSLGVLSQFDSLED